MLRLLNHRSLLCVMNYFDIFAFDSVNKIQICEKPDREVSILNNFFFSDSNPPQENVDKGVFV